MYFAQSRDSKVTAFFCFFEWAHIGGFVHKFTQLCRSVRVRIDHPVHNLTVLDTNTIRIVLARTTGASQRTIEQFGQFAQFAEFVHPLRG